MKHFPRIAVRYEKLARCLLACTALVAFPMAGLNVSRPAFKNSARICYIQGPTTGAPQEKKRVISHGRLLQKVRRIGDYGQLKEISCRIKRQAIARVVVKYPG